MKVLYVIWWLDQDGKYHHDVEDDYNKARKLAEDTSKEWGRAELERDDFEGHVEVFEDGSFAGILNVA